MDDQTKECIDLCNLIIRRDMDVINEERLRQTINDAEHYDYWNDGYQE